jgi:translation initiation factor 3 subunit G
MTLCKRQWKKFGMCADLPPGPEKGITEVSPDSFELLLGPQVKQEAKEEKSIYANVECRLCKKKGEHYTANCPLKDVLRANEEPEKGEAPKHEVYRPPNRRGGDDKTESTSGRDELPTVRVSNLSESAFENDLQELFKPFGPVQRVFIAKDKTTGESRGFGFVTFYHREDAAKAIAKLDGHGYDHLILHLEWALPSKK